MGGPDDILITLPVERQSRQGGDGNILAQAFNAVGDKGGIKFTGAKRTNASDVMAGRPMKGTEIPSLYF